MYSETVLFFSKVALGKKLSFQNSPIAFLISAMMAGVYIGFGIILIFSVAGHLEPPYQKLVMGLTFGIALTLIVFAGAELFTGHTMYMTFGYLQKVATFIDLIKIWITVWLGNFAGSVLLALIFIAAGGTHLLGDSLLLLQKVVAFKMNSPAIELLARATLCNWLVCLALWMSARTHSDSAKCIIIFWCLFAFISSGYEHSIANMTLFSIVLLTEHDHSIFINGMSHNLFWVTLGNIIGGSFFIGFGYWFISKEKSETAVTTENLTLSDAEK